MAPGRNPLPFLETDEATDAPMTAVGSDRAALAVGVGPTREIAIASVTTGRVVRRLRGTVATATSLAASADGKTLYFAAAGAIWAIGVEGGAERKISDGDSVTVEPESGDLIVKLDELQRFRLQRVDPVGGRVQELAVTGSDLRLADRPLMPGAVRNGRLLFTAATDDSWFWQVGQLDLRSGTVSRVPIPVDTDLHLAAWNGDGSILAVGLGVRSTLWRYAKAER